MTIMHQPASISRPAAASAVIFSSVSSTDRACGALRRAMWREGYNEAIIGEVISLARRDGDLVEAIATGRICSEDADQFTEIFARSFDVVPFDDASWDDDDRWEIDADLPPTEAELAAALTLPRGIPTADDSRAFARLDGRHDIRARVSNADWADYVSWANWRDEAYPPLPDISEAEWAEIGFRAGHPCEA